MRKSVEIESVESGIDSSTLGERAGRRGDGRPVDPPAEESFPASEPPAWIGCCIGVPRQSERKQHQPAQDPQPSPPSQVGSMLPRDSRDAGTVSSLPGAESAVRRASVGDRPVDRVSARIYRRGRSPTQSGMARSQEWVVELEPRWAPWIEPLMGWTASRDTLQQVRLTFPDCESAIAFARRHGWSWTVIPTHEPHHSPQAARCTNAAATEEASDEDCSDRPADRKRSSEAIRRH